MIFGKELFIAPEVYFSEKPESEGFRGIHQLISQSLEKCDADQRKDLIPNIQLIGGGSSFASTPDRLQKELLDADFLGMGSKMKVFTTNEKSERSISSWLGATIMGSMKMFDKFIISRKEYEEHGAAHVEKRLWMGYDGEWNVNIDLVFDHKISLNSANIMLISSVTLLALGWYSRLKFLWNYFRFIDLNSKTFTSEIMNSLFSDETLTFSLFFFSASLIFCLFCSWMSDLLGATSSGIIISNPSSSPSILILFLLVFWTISGLSSSKLIYTIGFLFSTPFSWFFLEIPPYLSAF